MLFTPTPREIAIKDAANIQNTGEVSWLLLVNEYKKWQLKLTETDPPQEKGRQLARFFLERTENAITERKLAASVQSRRAKEIIFREICAGFALSRLLHTVVEAGHTTYRDTNDSYIPGAMDSKLLIDYDTHDPAAARRGAYSVTIHKDRAQSQPFQFDLNPNDESESWHINPEGGLYVAISTPATISSGLMEDLVLATGSNREAQKIVDSQNSLNLIPYMSLNYLAAHFESPR